MLGFARHLPKFDWQVSIVASGSLPWQSDDPELIRDVPAVTHVKYVEFPIEKQRSIPALVLQRLRVVRGMYYWNEPAICACREIIEGERPDAILTSGPPHTVHLMGLALQRQYGLPWVADFRDPWCSWGTERHYGRKFGGFNKLWESRVFQKADLVIANTQKTAEMFCDVYPTTSRIVAIPNGYEPLPWEDSAKNGSDPTKIMLVHTGVIYVGRDPRPVAEAIHSINDAQLLGERRVHLKLIGQCLDSELHRDLRSRGLVRYVEMQEHVPHQDAVALHSADLLLLLDTPGRRIGVPANSTSM